MRQLLHYAASYETLAIDSMKKAFIVDRNKEAAIKKEHYLLLRYNCFLALKCGQG